MTIATVDRPIRRRRASPTVTATGVLIAWAAWHATTSRDVLNTRGWSSFLEFWKAALDPDLNADFLRLTGEATLTTGAYAVLGAVASIAVGLAGAPLLAERPWETAGGSTIGRLARAGCRRIVRALFVVPRAVHEIIWALLLVQVLGFDPLVAVLAIAFQFGAITAKVSADLLDDANPSAFRAMRTAGAGRLTAPVYGLVPAVRRDMIGYGFYRLECAVRSAAVLGIVGLGGLGNQLDLSFESLRYDEIWTLIAALMLLSGLADRWSTAVRHSGSTTVVRGSWIALARTGPRLVVVRRDRHREHVVGADPSPVRRPGRRPVPAATRAGRLVGVGRRDDRHARDVGAGDGDRGGGRTRARDGGRAPAPAGRDVRSPGRRLDRAGRPALVPCRARTGVGVPRGAGDVPGHLARSRRTRRVQHRCARPTVRRGVRRPRRSRPPLPSTPRVRVRSSS
ncbi:MAG: ABC transporter permease subunit [Ilumatobacteraceae bacterium]